MSKKISSNFIYTFLFLLAPFISFCQADGDYIVHTVKPGEVPAVLCKKYNVPLPELYRLNKWGAKVVLHVGDKIKLPLTAHAGPVGDSVSKLPPVVKAPPAVGVPDELEGRAAPATPRIEAPPVQPTADTTNYTWHTIEKGEIPSMLAKKYKVNVDELKKINNWNVKTIWHVGDKVKLPRSKHSTGTADTAKTVEALPKENIAAQANTSAADTAAKATVQATQVNYVVQKKETLYSISRKFKVTVAQIKNWNHLMEDNITEGQTLVLFTAGNGTPPIIETKAPAAIPVTAAPAPVKPQPEKQSSLVTQAAEQVVQHKPAGDSVIAAVPAEGYFAPLFGKDVAGRSLNSATGMAMTFKTASGWTDKKYYVLMNDVPPGSIVKITNADGKSVYAKVLWNMGDAQDNEGLNFRISDAAASALGFKDLKFQVTVGFYK